MTHVEAPSIPERAPLQPMMGRLRAVPDQLPEGGARNRPVNPESTLIGVQPSMRADLSRERWRWKGREGKGRAGKADCRSLDLLILP